MKTKILLSLLLSFSFYLLSSQVPQGFNYQAIARNSVGDPIIGATIKVRLSIMSDSTGFFAGTGGVYVWEEEHVNVKTNAFGLFTIVMGNPLATKIQGTSGSFSAINWSSGPLYIGTRIANPTSFKNLGSAKLWTVPYSMVAGSVTGTGNLKKLSVTGQTTIPDSALFEVKNYTGQTVFAVYNEGVRVYVDNGIAKGATKGGFAIGGFGTAKAPSQNLMMISPDSARIYVSEAAAKGKKGGFAIGGFDGAKGTTNKFMKLTPQNYFIGHNSGINDTVGIFNSTLGYETGKNLVTGSNNVFIGYQSGLTTKSGGSNVFIGTQAGYFNSAGNYNIILGRQAGYNNTASSNIFLGDLTGLSNSTGSQNVFIGDWAGYRNTFGLQNVFLGAEAGWNNLTGNYNNFMGFRSGYQNTTGSFNSFIGYQAGYNNTAGEKNTYLGYQAGYSGLLASGANNIFMGVEAGYSNTLGHDNIAIGNKAGRSILDGIYNVMIGSDAGITNISGDYNTLLGYKAGEKHVGDFATLVGYLAGNLTISGNSQTMLGYMAGSSNTGSYNTFLGTLAGDLSGAGQFNTYIGLAAGREATGSNNVFVGRWAGWYETGSNKLVIETIYNGADNYNNALIYGDFAAKFLRVNGNISSVNTLLSDDTPGVQGQHNVTPFYGIGVQGIGGYKGVEGLSTYVGAGSRFGVVGSASGGAYNYGIYGSAVGGTAYAGYFSGNVNYTGTLTNTSDKRLKRNILPLSGALNKILDIQGVTFEWKSEEELASLNMNKGGNIKDQDKQSYNFPEGLQIGVIAQDVEKVLPELVHTDTDGLKSVDYIKMIPLLIEAIKDQQKQIDELKAKIGVK